MRREEGKQQVRDPGPRQGRGTRPARLHSESFLSLSAWAPGPEVCPIWAKGAEILGSEAGLGHRPRPMEGFRCRQQRGGHTESTGPHRLAARVLTLRGHGGAQATTVLTVAHADHHTPVFQGPTGPAADPVSECLRQAAGSSPRNPAASLQPAGGFWPKGTRQEVPGIHFPVR